MTLGLLQKTGSRRTYVRCRALPATKLPLYRNKGCLFGRKGNFAGSYRETAKVLSLSEGIEGVRKKQNFLSGAEPDHESDSFADSPGF
jgi:hypothetical protein